MKTINLVFLVILFEFISGCTQPKFLRKVVETQDIKVLWYYYSNISNNSPDIIEVSNGSKSKIIFKGVDLITNISILQDTIIINMYKPERGIIIEDNTKDKVFEYYVRLNSTATLDDYKKIPYGKKNNEFGDKNRMEKTYWC